MTVELPIISRRTDTQFTKVEDIRFEPEFTVEKGGFTAYQKQAWDLYKKTSFPTSSDEAWRRTSLRDLHLGQLVLSGQSDDSIQPIPDSLIKPLADDKHGGQILFSSLNVSIQLENSLVDQGVIFTDLQHAQSDSQDLLNKIAATVKINQESKFSALAASFGTQGIFVYIPKGVRVTRPLHSLLWASGKNELHTFQIFVYLEDDSSLTYVHENASPDNMDSQCVYTGNIHIYVGKNAKLNFVELQSFGRNVWNFSHEDVRVDQNGEIDWIFGALGSQLTKNFSTINLIGEGSVGKISGFYFADGTQHLDHDTQQNHLAPHTTSDLLYKGAVMGESHSVWQGMIYVDPNATKTDGYQANRNLVLSPTARADSIPGLEILTDDVRCTHGATVGKIDTDQLFYLESRGIPRIEAEKVIVEGFFDPIMQRIPFEGVKTRFKNAIETKMNAHKE